MTNLKTPKQQLKYLVNELSYDKGYTYSNNNNQVIITKVYKDIDLVKLVEQLQLILTKITITILDNNTVKATTK